MASLGVEGEVQLLYHLDPQLLEEHPLEARAVEDLGGLLLVG